MLTIRLTRKGKKNQPFFRVVVVDKRRSSKGGRAVEELGYVDPLTKKKSLKKERVLHWLKVGAKPSPTVHNLLVSEKVIDAKKVHVSKMKKNKEITDVPKASEVAVAAEPAKAVGEKEAVKSPEIEKPAEKLIEQPIEKPVVEPQSPS